MSEFRERIIFVSALLVVLWIVLASFVGVTVTVDGVKHVIRLGA